MHPRDQWFRIYKAESGVAGPVVDRKTKAVTIGWIKPPIWEVESDIEHVHHPDFYHPDPYVRMRHHRATRTTGMAVAACGKPHDARLRFVETDGNPVQACSECRRVTEGAKAEHEEALRLLKANAEGDQ